VDDRAAAAIKAKPLGTTRMQSTPKGRELSEEADEESTERAGSPFREPHAIDCKWGKVTRQLNSPPSMTTTRGPTTTGTLRAARSSASLLRDTYRTLQDIADQKKAFVPWVIREAAEKYIVEQWSLFSKR
jgi:hypothetical protein